jgi:O-antigen/teichoic acid export membrane protein
MTNAGRMSPGSSAGMRVGWYGLAQVANAALAMVLLGILARSLGSAGFGEFSFAFVVASLGALLADFGLGPWLTRSAAREPGAAGVLLSRVLRVRLPLVAATWVVVLGAMSLYPGGADRLPVIAAMLAYVTGLGYAMMYESLLMSRGDVRGVGASLLLGKVLELALVAVLVTVRPGAGAAAAAGAMALACALRVAFVRGLARAAIAGDASPAGPSGGQPWRAIVSGATPFAVGLVLWTVYSKVDVMMLERFVPADQLGLYTAAYRVLEALFLIPRSVVGVHFPIYAEAWARRDLDRAAASAPLKLLLLGAMAAATLVITAPADILLMLFGPAFTGAAPAMRILGLALVALFVNQFQSMYLGATDRQHVWLRRLAVAILVNVTANLVLIPTIGIRGAATATLLSESFLLVIFVVAARRELFQGIDAGWLARALLAVGALAGLLVANDAPPLVRFALAGLAFVTAALALRLVDPRTHRRKPDVVAGAPAPAAAEPPPAPGPATVDLSVVVLTYQSARTLDATLRSVAFAGEILVIDSGSTDDTLAIARRHGARIIPRAMTDGWAAQRNFGQARAAGRWILALDSDEVPDETLAAALRRVTSAAAGPGDHAGYTIRMLNYFLGRPMRHGGLDRDDHLRLVRRGAGRWEGAVHESLDVAGTVGHLPGLAHHMTGVTFEQRLAKAGTYARKRAEVWRAAGRKPSVARAVWEPLRFLAGRLIIRGGWRDGLTGFVWWWLQATELLGAHLILAVEPLYRPEAAPKIAAASDSSFEPETHVGT